MKNNIKRLLPYVIINALIYAIIGAIIGKNYVNIRNTKRKINNDYKAISKFLKDVGGSATQIKVDVPEDFR